MSGARVRARAQMGDLYLHHHKDITSDVYARMFQNMHSADDFERWFPCGPLVLQARLFGADVHRQTM